MLVIHNTLSGKKEQLKKLRAPLKLFVCGPTVYGPAHIGHARVEVFFDTVARHLRESGYPLRYLQNITDVDDKIIDRARAEKKLPRDIARVQEKEYLVDMKALRVTSVDRRARASEFIVEIRRQINRLMDKGYAYLTSSGVYFEVRRFSDYGALSKQNLDDVRPGWRIELDSEKKDPLDFALWKFSKTDDEMSWPSPWGRGRPGWHIEDTAITEKLLGQQYDLHGGGVDLKFPHHESEIAQAEAISGKKPFVKIWMHVGSVMMDGEKMSKSKGNIATIRTFLDTYSVNVLRFMLMSVQYRSPLHYSPALVRQTVSALQTIEQFLRALDFVASVGLGKGVSARPVRQSLDRCLDEFMRAMDDDFNTPNALAAFFFLINDYQKKLWELDPSEAEAIRNFLVRICARFGLLFKTAGIPIHVKALTKKRETLRAAQDFKAADEARLKIEALGYTVEDTPLGPLVTKA